MRKVISWRNLQGIKRYYGVYNIVIREDGIEESARCVSCGRGITEDDVQTGWVQYALDRTFDEYTVLCICPECGKHFAYRWLRAPSK